MQIILSRKGFDSASGGGPSPILPDGTLLSLPIPEDTDFLGGAVPYADLRVDAGLVRRRHAAAGHQGPCWRRPL